MPVVASRIRASLTPDEAPFAVNGHVVLVPKVRNRNIDKASILLTLLGGFGL